MLVGAISTLAARLSGAIACALMLGCEQPRKSASPPPSSEPVFTPATDQLVFQDNMDAYTSAAALYTGTVPNQHVIQATVGGGIPNPDPADQLITPGRGGRHLNGQQKMVSLNGARSEPVATIRSAPPKTILPIHGGSCGPPARSPLQDRGALW